MGGRRLLSGKVLGAGNAHGRELCGLFHDALKGVAKDIATRWRARWPFSFGSVHPNSTYQLQRMRRVRGQRNKSPPLRLRCESARHSAEPRRKNTPPPFPRPRSMRLAARKETGITAENRQYRGQMKKAAV